MNRETEPDHMQRKATAKLYRCSLMSPKYTFSVRGADFGKKKKQETPSTSATLRSYPTHRSFS